MWPYINKKKLPNSRPYKLVYWANSDVANWGPLSLWIVPGIPCLKKIEFKDGHFWHNNALAEHHKQNDPVAKFKLLCEAGVALYICPYQYS